MVVGQIRFLVGFWTEDLSSLLAAGRWLPSVSCCLGLSIWQLAASDPARKRVCYQGGSYSPM